MIKISVSPEDVTIKQIHDTPNRIRTQRYGNHELPGIAWDHSG